MKRLAILLVMATFSVGVLGACCTVNEAFVNGMDSGAKVILPRYVNYVQNDANLDEDTKEERIRTADKMRELIDEALEKAED